jgi:peptidoglycan/LPS O-acetylase OafA/YrhL
MTARLSRETSLYLDAVRFIAAMAVFLGHFATRNFSGGLFWQIAPFRYDAVDVFFVLSGFVIAHATAQSERSALTYVVNRAARLYSVVVPAIAVTVTCDAIGRWLVPSYLGEAASPYPLWLQLTTGLSFIHQSWVWDPLLVPGSDAPFWSLGYEVPYYATFGCLLFVRSAWRFVLPVALLLLAGPGVTALFPLWLVGVALYRYRDRLALSERTGWMLFLGSIAVWSGIEFWALSTRSWILDDWVPILGHDRIPADYISGLCFAANVLGFDRIGHRFALPLKFLAPVIRRAAGNSFTLYLVHYPVMTLCIALAPWEVSATPTRALTLGATVAVTITIAELFERRKEPWRRFFTALAARLRDTPRLLRALLVPTRAARGLSLPLARETSVYLDGMRFFAALIVVFVHFAGRAISGGVLWQFAPYGQDAVMLFFVLSGFVIAHATTRGEISAADYIGARAARIYSVAIPAIAITLFCDYIGGLADPHYFDWAYALGPVWQQVVTSLSFTNEFWNLRLFPGSNLPYWSLGYEVVYYAIFGCAIFARGSWRYLLPLAVLLAAGPSIATLFPLWLLGVAVYRFGRRWRLSEAMGWLLCLGSVVAWALAETSLLGIRDMVDDSSAFVPLAALPGDYLTAIAFALHLVGLEAIAHRLSALLHGLAPLIRWAAGRSFTLYLVHFPVMKLSAVLSPWPVDTWTSRLFVLATTAIVVLVAAECFEQRRHAWRRFFATALRASHRPRSATGVAT